MNPFRGKKTLTQILALTAAFEVVTILFRFGFKLESSRATASTIGVLTQGIRFHHGYFGVLLMGLAFAFARRRPGWAHGMLVLGGALLLSDLVHHFLVLWPLTGSPEFHLIYPEK